MTRVTASFEEAVRTTSATFARRKTRAALGIIEKVPKTTNEWIVLYNGNNVQAPGGGPAFIPSKNRQGQKGDALTGAIGVRWTKAKAPKAQKNGKIKAGRPAQMQLWRPLYSDLIGQRAIIDANSVVITKFTK
jgi:hypothetical protein